VVAFRDKQETVEKTPGRNFENSMRTVFIVHDMHPACSQSRRYLLSLKQAQGRQGSNVYKISWLHYCGLLVDCSETGLGFFPFSGTMFCISWWSVLSTVHLSPRDSTGINSDTFIECSKRSGNFDLLYFSVIYARNNHPKC
jgi:hypothetical protein